jgi:hypothetical protein
MEMERRPVAARRLVDAPRAPRATPIPSCDGALVARMEQSRRVKAAKRLGLFVTSDVFVDAAFEAVAPPFAGTAAAEMERARRPRAAARLASLSAVDASLEMSPVVSVAGAALADTACARMEQARRPARRRARGEAQPPERAALDAAPRARRRVCHGRGRDDRRRARLRGVAHARRLDRG